MVKENKIISVINDYLLKVDVGMELFRNKIGDTPPLKAWHRRQISSKGSLSSNVKYELHGIGCLLIFSDCEVDFDFEPDSKCRGFDLWRLSEYITSCTDCYSEYINKDRLKEDFEKAENEGLIFKSHQSYSNLYFLRSINELD